MTRVARYLACFLAAILIADCHGPGVTPQGSSNFWNAARPKTASGQSLIWTIYGDVNAYTFSGQLVAQLGGFSFPVGLCTDPSGDVYVVDQGRQEIFVYAPGQGLPFYIYDDLGETPNGCAFDPSSGNLSIANDENVTVFPPASGTPLVYRTAQMQSYSNLGYDKAGNLYVDGTGANGRSLALAKLSAGTGKLKFITVSNLPAGKHRAGGLAWDGQDVAIADWLGHCIYRIAISGATGNVVDAWQIVGWKRNYNPRFAIDGKRLLFPAFNGHEVEFFRYPPKGRAKTGFFGNIGDVLSVGPEIIN